ncbi:MAG TPA: TlpA disulfide reductase family protein [Mycobacteriales bacterium]|nr:TlpA disulfide reductase family protein [Mycobacteriales bacterium]
MSRPVAAALAALVLLAGCSASKHADGPPTFPNNPDHEQLVRAAHLEPCPATSGAPAAGGLPDVTLHCLGKGPQVRMAALRGRPTLVNIWGSWCGPCQQETPYLQQAHARLGAKVRFLGVDTEDSANSALDFAAHARPPMRYPSVVDDDKAVLLGVHGPSAVPMTIFVGADGRVVHLATHPYAGVDAVLADVARYLGVRT